MQTGSKRFMKQSDQLAQLREGAAQVRVNRSKRQQNKANHMTELDNQKRVLVNGLRRPHQRHNSSTYTSRKSFNNLSIDDPIGDLMQKCKDENDAKHRLASEDSIN